MDSSIANALAKRKEAILEKWLGLIAEAHPAGPNLFKDKNQFANPIGHTLSCEAKSILDEIAEGQVNSEKVVASLDKITRITAIQDCAPAQAIGFVFLLKKALRNQLAAEIREKKAFEQLLELESEIDDLALLAFNSYVSSREQIYRIRVNEVKIDRDNAFRLLDRINLRHADLEDGMASGYNTSEVTE